MTYRPSMTMPWLLSKLAVDVRSDGHLRDVLYKGHVSRDIRIRREINGCTQHSRTNCQLRDLWGVCAFSLCYFQYALDSRLQHVPGSVSRSR